MGTGEGWRRKGWRGNPHGDRRDGSGGDHRWDGGPRDRGSVANPRMEDVPKRKGVASMIDELASLETKEGMAYSGWRTWWIRRGCPL